MAGLLIKELMIRGDVERRLATLARERDISALPPQVRGGAVIVPAGLVRAKVSRAEGDRALRETTAEGRTAVARLAMEAVMDVERALGCDPRDVSAERPGYDIESRENATGRLRFIEVKGHVDGAGTVTVTRNEILTALNAPDAFMLAIVEVSNGFAAEPLCVRRPFKREPDFGATNVTYTLTDLLARA